MFISDNGGLKKFRKGSWFVARRFALVKQSRLACAQTNNLRYEDFKLSAPKILVRKDKDPTRQIRAQRIFFVEGFQNIILPIKQV